MNIYWVCSLTCAKGIKVFAERLEERGHNALVHLQLLAAPPDGDFSSFRTKFVPYESTVDGFSAKSRVCRGFVARVVPSEGGDGPLGSLESTSTSEQAVC